MAKKKKKGKSKRQHIGPHEDEADWGAHPKEEWHRDVTRRQAEAMERRTEEIVQAQIKKLVYVLPSGYLFYLRIFIGLTLGLL